MISFLPPTSSTRKILDVPILAPRCPWIHRSGIMLAWSHCWPSFRKLLRRNVSSRIRWSHFRLGLVVGLRCWQRLDIWRVCFKLLVDRYQELLLVDIYIYIYAYVQFRFWYKHTDLVLTKVSSWQINIYFIHIYIYTYLWLSFSATGNL